MAKDNMSVRSKITKFIRLYGGPMYPILKKYRHNQIVKRLKANEKIVKYGDKNPDKIFYICKRDLPREGLMSYTNNFLGHIVYAVEQGYIPVVDMKNFKNTYLEPEDIGKKNAWELFYKQPTEFSLEEAYESQNVIISNGQPSPFRLVDEDSNMLEEWHEYWHKYIHFTEETENIINQEYKKIINKEDVVLGVNIRGTDYVSLQQPGLPIQPKVEELMIEARKWMEKYKCNKIFLCCEDQLIVDQFRSEFKNKLVTNERKFYRKTTGDEPVTDITFERANDRYLRGIEYLTTIGILSKCDYLLGGLSGATLSAQLIRPLGKPYKDMYIYKLGHIK